MDCMGGGSWVSFRQDLGCGHLQLEDGILIWWSLLAMAVAGCLGLFHWVMTDPGAERELARERFRAEQEGRAVRRASKLTPR
jgi:hypothetical protein